MYALILKNHKIIPSELILNINQPHTVSALSNGLPYKAKFVGPKDMSKNFYMTLPHDSEFLSI